MGLTPLEGVLMGTRAGSMDTAIVQYIMQNTGKSIDDVMSELNKKSGFLGVSGVSSDMRDVMSAAAEGNENAALSVDMWAYGIKKLIGAYAAAMGGLDVLVFTAGIGENDSVARAMLCENMEFLGIKIDPSKNDGVRGKETVLSADDSKVKVLLIPTDEELAIAQDTAEIVSKL